MILTAASHQAGTEPRLQVLVLQAFVDVDAAAQQRLYRFRLVEEDEGAHAHPDQVHVPSSFPHLIIFLKASATQRIAPFLFNRPEIGKLELDGRGRKIKSFKSLRGLL